MYAITNFTAFDENTEAIYSDVKKLKYFGDRIIKIVNEKNKRAKNGFQIKLLAPPFFGIYREVPIWESRSNLSYVSIVSERL